MLKLQDLLPVAILLGVTIVGLTVVADIVTDINADQTAGSVAANVSGEGLNALQELGSWTPTLALVVAAALIIGILISAFAFGKR